MGGQKEEKRWGGDLLKRKNNGKRGNEATVVSEWHMRQCGGEGEERGTMMEADMDEAHNNSCSALFGAFEKTVALCVNTKTTRSSVGPHIHPLTHADGTQMCLDIHCHVHDMLLTHFRTFQ